MNILFLFLPSAIVLARYLFADSREMSPELARCNRR